MAHTNHLVHESSPYLQQHAYNPVDWYPWGPEALDLAMLQQKPILLSIGYSSCHWCHVMERESFENEEIAGLMNESFICIKVDREERPDLDSIYQVTAQMVTGQGGWPLTVFLTPDRKPFWAGTYFPPHDSYGRPGFENVLTAISEHFHARPDRVSEAARDIMLALSNHFSRPCAKDDSGEDSYRLEALEETLSTAFDTLASRYDARNGGFGAQPKFPGVSTLDLLLRCWTSQHNSRAMEMFLLTLRRMAEGGIYDQLGGGFHRYSTDAKWLVPHFEKMLYDNALLARIYTQSAIITGDRVMREVAEGTLDYLIREMVSPEGGFYTAQDADSEGEEGRFFVWTPAEVGQVLGSEGAALFCNAYCVSEEGNFEHATSILSVVESQDRLAHDYALTDSELRGRLSQMRAQLLDERERRVHPFRDEKVLVSWNGLAISAFALAGKVFHRADYLDVALKAVRLISEACTPDLPHSIEKRMGHGPAFLDDYAFFIAGLLELYEAVMDDQLVWQASLLTERAIELFGDPDSGDFFMTSEEDPSLIIRPREPYDQANPSAVSIMTMNLLKLSVVLDRPEWRERAGRALQANLVEMIRVPTAAASLVCAWALWRSGPDSMVILCDPENPEAKNNLDRLHRRWKPDMVMMVARPGEGTLPPTRDIKLGSGDMIATVCKGFECAPPIYRWDELLNAI